MNERQRIKDRWIWSLVFRAAVGNALGIFYSAQVADAAVSDPKTVRGVS